MTVSIHKRKRIDASAASRAEDPSARCLIWWRSKLAGEFDADALQTMRSSLSEIAIIGEDRWRDAAAGDAAAAIGIVYGLKRGPTHGGIFDAGMTALALAAGMGDAAACLVLATVLRGVPGAGTAEASIATTWLARAFASHHSILRRRTGDAS